MWRNQSGLTLVEMAIVLIVIGIFLAGVVPKGRQMLEQARLKKTVVEIQNHIMIVSQFLENTGNSSQSTQENNAIWSKLQKEGALPYGQVLQKDTDVECPKLSNGGFLSLHFKEDRYVLILGKKGRGGKQCGFMTMQQAYFLKKSLELKGVEILTDNQEVVKDPNLNVEDLEHNKHSDYAIQIPID